MDQVRLGRERTAIARRVVCRTLTIVGGAAAGTALAWFLSTGTASADPFANLPTDTPVDLLGDARPVLSEAVAPLGGALDTLAKVPAISLDHVGDQLTEATTRVELLPDGGLGDLVGLAGVGDVVEAVELPVGADDLVTVPPAPRPAPPTAPPVAAGTPGAPAGQEADPEHTAERTATERAYVTGMPHRGSPTPATPDTPSRPAPFTPNGSAPGPTGGVGANPADHAPSAALPWPDRAPGTARGLTATVAGAPVPGRAGDQPGTAPD